MVGNYWILKANEFLGALIGSEFEWWLLNAIDMYIPSGCLFSSAAIFSWLPKKAKPETWTFGVCFNLCLLNHWFNLKLLMITCLPRKRLWVLPSPKQIFWHLKIGRNPKGNSSSNHHFSGAMLVLGSVSWTTLDFEGQRSYSDLDHGTANRSMLTGGFKEISCSLLHWGWFPISLFFLRWVETTN